MSKRPAKPRREQDQASAVVQENPTRTPLVIWILAALAVAAAVVSLVAALRPETALSWVWPAAVGVFVGGAAWVMAAMWDSRKLPGVVGAALAAMGVAAALWSGLSFASAERAQAQDLVQQEDSEAAGDGYDESAQASLVPGEVSSARALGQAADVGNAHVVVTAVDAKATDAVRAEDAHVPAPQGRYVVATVEVTNQGEDPLSPGASLGYDLVFADGESVDSMQCQAQLKDSAVLAEDLEKNARGTYRVCFDVPKELDKDSWVSAAAVRVSDVLGDGVTPAYWRVGK